MAIPVGNLQCVCKRLVKEKINPDLKGFDCTCSGFDMKGREQILNVKRFVQVTKK